MTRHSLLVVAAFLISGVAMPSKSHAWGATHYGYTHVGPGGAYHVGGTAVRTPYGGYNTKSATAVGARGGVYHAAGAGGVYHPVPVTPVAGGYRAGGVAVGGYQAGVYRRY